MSQNTACRFIAAGNIDAAPALVALVEVGVLPVMVKADLPAPMLQVAINDAILFHYRELPALIAQSGGRAVFAAWCRQAGFTPPETLPEMVNLYRGTLQPGRRGHWAALEHAVRRRRLLCVPLRRS